MVASRIRANADAIVTFNLDDFPATATDPYEIDVLHPRCVPAEPARPGTEACELERAVSAHIRAMPLLWLSVSDRHYRIVIERDLIALLSNAGRDPLDAPSAQWLGHRADASAIRHSGLWNVHHVDRQVPGEGVDLFRNLVKGP